MKALYECLVDVAPTSRYATDPMSLVHALTQSQANTRITNNEVHYQIRFPPARFPVYATSDPLLQYVELDADRNRHIEFAKQLTMRVLESLGMLGYENTFDTLRRESVPIPATQPGQTTGNELVLEAKLDTVRIEDVPVNKLLKASDMPSQRMKEAVESLRAQVLAQQAMLTQD